MNSGTAKELRKMVQDEPPKEFLDEAIAVYGEDAILSGKKDLYKVAKKLWSKKSSKEKKTAWMK